MKKKNIFSLSSFLLLLIELSNTAHRGKEKKVLRIYDRQTDQPTDQPRNKMGQREVTFPINLMDIFDRYIYTGGDAEWKTRYPEFGWTDVGYRVGSEGG